MWIKRCSNVVSGWDCKRCGVLFHREKVNSKVGARHAVPLRMVGADAPTYPGLKLLVVGIKYWWWRHVLSVGATRRVAPTPLSGVGRKPILSLAKNVGVGADTCVCPYVIYIRR
jgi:hypothetical protein